MRGWSGRMLRGDRAAALSVSLKRRPETLRGTTREQDKGFGSPGGVLDAPLLSFRFPPFCVRVFISVHLLLKPCLLFLLAFPYLFFPSLSLSHCFPLLFPCPSRSHSPSLCPSSPSFPPFPSLFPSLNPLCRPPSSSPRWASDHLNQYRGPSHSHPISASKPSSGPTASPLVYSRVSLKPRRAWE